MSNLEEYEAYINVFVSLSKILFTFISFKNKFLLSVKTFSPDEEPSIFLISSRLTLPTLTQVIDDDDGSSNGLLDSFSVIGLSKSLKYITIFSTFGSLKDWIFNVSKISGDDIGFDILKNVTFKN